MLCVNYIFSDFLVEAMFVSVDPYMRYIFLFNILQGFLIIIKSLTYLA